jgi:nucleoside-diphosphate-sugar epimerase
VAGATGQTGRRVVQQLRAAGYKVRARARGAGPPHGRPERQREGPPRAPPAAHAHPSPPRPRSQVRAGVRDLRKAQSLGFALDPQGIELVECDVVKNSAA